jgi:hypothetical protein
MPLYNFWHNLLNVLIEIANKVELQKKNTRYRLNFYSKSKFVTTDGKSVSQYVLVSNPLWDLRQDINSVWKLILSSLWGTLSDERSRLSLVSHCLQYLSIVMFFAFFFFILCITHVLCITISIVPQSAEAQYSRSCPIICILRYKSLYNWTVMHLKATTFKPLNFLCRVSPCPTLRTWAFTWFCMIFACCLINFVI